MDKSACWISGVATRVGAVKHIEELRGTPGITDRMLEVAAREGSRHFCEEDYDLEVVYRDIVSQILQSSGIAGTEIDTVLFDASVGGGVGYPMNIPLLRALSSLGIEHTACLGLTGQFCSAPCAALMMAAGLIAAGERRNILLVLTSRWLRPRLAPGGQTAFSDGVASCVLSRRPGPYRLLAATTTSSVGLGALDPASPEALDQLFRSAMTLIPEVSRNLFRSAGVTAADIGLLLATNAAKTFHDIIASASGVPLSRLYADGLAARGHLQGLENWVDLAERAPVLREGDHVLFLNWSEYVYSGAIIRVE